MTDSTKREVRQHKREVKKAGGKRARRVLKRDLAENPDDAPFTPVDFGGLRSALMNGLDRDATRRKDNPGPG